MQFFNNIIIIINIHFIYIYIYIYILINKFKWNYGELNNKIINLKLKF